MTPIEEIAELIALSEPYSSEVTPEILACANNSSTSVPWLWEQIRNTNEPGLREMFCELLEVQIEALR